MHLSRPYPLHVFADTCALRGQSPSSLVLRRVAELAKTGRLVLHVPLVVEGELQSQLASLISLPSRDLGRIAAWLPEDDRKRVIDAIDVLRSTAKNAKSLFERGVADWLIGVEAIRHDIHPEGCGFHAAQLSPADETGTGETD